MSSLCYYYNNVYENVKFADILLNSGKYKYCLELKGCASCYYSVVRKRVEFYVKKYIEQHIMKLLDVFSNILNCKYFFYDIECFLCKNKNKNILFLTDCGASCDLDSRVKMLKDCYFDMEYFENEIAYIRRFVVNGVEYLLVLCKYFEVNLGNIEMLERICENGRVKFGNYSVPVGGVCVFSGVEHFSFPCVTYFYGIYVIVGGEACLNLKDEEGGILSLKIDLGFNRILLGNMIVGEVYKFVCDCWRDENGLVFGECKVLGREMLGVSVFRGNVVSLDVLKKCLGWRDGMKVKCDMDYSGDISLIMKHVKIDCYRIFGFCSLDLSLINVIKILNGKVCLDVLNRMSDRLDVEDIVRDSGVKGVKIDVMSYEGGLVEYLCGKRFEIGKGDYNFIFCGFLLHEIFGKLDVLILFLMRIKDMLSKVGVIFCLMIDGIGNGDYCLEDFGKYVCLSDGIRMRGYWKIDLEILRVICLILGLDVGVRKVDRVFCSVVIGHKV